MILSRKVFYSSLALILAINLIIAFTNPIFLDPSVYWFYAHHLRWVYADAPPLIGVVTWLGIALCGSHDATINMLGLSSVLLAMYFLYCLAKSMYDDNIARIAALIWLLTPTTLHVYFRWSWSYNNLILLFSMMVIYFFHEANKTRSPLYFYMTALSLAALILSQVNSVLIIISLCIPLVILPSYRSFFRNKHFYFSLLLTLAIITPYLAALSQSHFRSLTYLNNTHSTTHHVFFLQPVIHLFLETINELNIFFLIGLWLIVKNFHLIKQNENLLFCLLISSTLFLLASILSITHDMPIRYYYPFYFTFILLFVPFLNADWSKWLMFAIYFNVALFLIDSWNVIVPQYSIANGSSRFRNETFQMIGYDIKHVVAKNDILIPCIFSNTYTLLAFNADHINTYFSPPELFIWQAPIQQVLAQSKGNKIFYLCNNEIPAPKNLGLTCNMIKRFSATIPSHLNHKHYTDIYYLWSCRYNGLNQPLKPGLRPLMTQ